MNAIIDHSIASPLGHISVDSVTIRWGAGARSFEAVQNVSFAVRPGGFTCLLGPSGCGKSTLLGALAGHLKPVSGHLLVDGVQIGAPDSSRGIVFQHTTLFPWKTVLENISFGPKMHGVPKKERHDQAREILALVGLGDFADRYPSQLSGGMQQRAEIARVLVNKPRLLLMDEPFGALDALTRSRMQELLLDIWSRVRTTIIFVTHDIDEALFLGDQILVMSPRPGRILDTIDVAFPRPRPPELVVEPEFGRLKRRCLDLLHHHDREALPRLWPHGESSQRANR